MTAGDLFKFIHGLETENSRLKVLLAFQTCWIFWLSVELIKETNKKEKTKKGA